MFLIKVAIWLVMFPITVVGFAWMSILEWVAFLFNSPIDIWTIVSHNVDEATAVKE
jgi:hypothetical protein